jgi:tRNA pseudouridine38-40 synthase
VRSSLSLNKSALKTEKNIKLVIEYDGTGYAGWQRQKNMPTIQEAIEKALTHMLNRQVVVYGAGRTDAGVHALGQVAHFFCTEAYASDTFKRALNSLLSNDIVILQAEEVGLEFHARYSAVSKTYRYLILNRSTPSALERNRVWFYPAPLNLAPMKECLAMIQGTNDFSSFRTQGSQSRSSIRTVFEQSLISSPNGLISITLRADGYLRHMVRTVVGTIVEVGRSKLSPADFQAILLARNRSRAGPTLPPQGLYLVSVAY